MKRRRKLSSSTQSRDMKRRRKQREVKVQVPFLPQEIITNILKRLPVKSLILFKSVCKHWKNLTKTQSFIHEHLNHASNQNPSLLFRDRSPADLLQLSFIDNEMKVVEVHCTDLPRDSSIIGSSNGLLCVKLKNPSHTILLWNPAIRQVRRVPKPANCFAGCSFGLGFGFSSIVNDYKILTIYFLPSMRNFRGEVYSLMTGSWKEVESSPLRDVTFLGGRFAANGSIFWFGFKRSVEGRVHILVSYDMAAEVFTLIPSPILPLNAFESLSTRLTVHENKLAILSHTFIGDPAFSLIDLWVMEDGTGKSVERCGWTKKFSISHPLLSVARTIWRNQMVCLPTRIGATEVETSGDERKSIALVNLTTGEVNMSAICICGSPHFFLNYVESLVPISNNYWSKKEGDRGEHRSN